MSLSIPDLLIGILAGLALGEIARFLRAWVTAHRRTQTVRAVLYSEVESNRNQLRTFWEKVRPRKNVDEIHRVDKVVYAREFAETELPHFSRTVYEEQLPLLPAAIGSERFMRLARFYTNLARIEQMHTELHTTRAQDIAAHQVVPAGMLFSAPASVTYDLFLRKAARMWDEVQHTIEQLLEDKNPLN